MFSLKAVRTKNLRSISDSGFVELKPITILVGRNSSGKSTFARLLPLLRQSAEAVTRSPLLWYGRFVDFGTISDALGKNSQSKTVELGYRFESIDESDLDVHDFFDEDLPFSVRNIYYESYFPLASRSLPKTVDVFVSLAPTLADKARVECVKLQIFDVEISFQFSESGAVRLVVDGDEIFIDERYEVRRNEGLLIPNISITKNVEGASRKELFQYRLDFLHERFIDFIQDNLVHGRTARATVGRIARQVPVCSPNELKVRIKNVSGVKSWGRSAGKLLKDSDLFDRFRKALYLAAVPSILRLANQALSSYVTNVKYLEPLRATAQRFYRRQDLAIDEIDSRGENVAMFLDSLSHREREEFGSWCENELGFNVSAMPDGGHVSIKLKHRDERDWTNLADMGFGFSQVLPIAIQLWSSTYRRRRGVRGARIDRRQCLVVEQPELHLHPAFQGRLADLFVRAINLGESSGGLSQILVETHSPQFIYRLGELVEEGVISREKIQIILFEKLDSDRGTVVSTAGFDGRGILQNWPAGFFELDPVC